MWSRIVNHCHNERSTNATWYGALIVMGFTSVMLYLITVDNVPTSSILTEIKSTHEAVKTLVTTSSKMDKQMDRIESAFMPDLSPMTSQLIQQKAMEMNQ